MWMRSSSRMTSHMLHMNNDHILLEKNFLRPEITNIFEQGYKSSPYLGATKTINVEVKSKVEQLQVVGDCSENLKS